VRNSVTTAADAESILILERISSDVDAASSLPCECRAVRNDFYLSFGLVSCTCSRV